MRLNVSNMRLSMSLVYGMLTLVKNGGICKMNCSTSSTQMSKHQTRGLLSSYVTTIVMSYVVISYIEISVLVTHTKSLTCLFLSVLIPSIAFKCIEGLNNK